MSTPQTTQPPETKQPVPRGAIFIGLLLYLFAAAVVASLALPADARPPVPPWSVLLYALALGVLATGLFRKRRWAWLGALAFVIVHAYFVSLGAFIDGQTRLIGLALLGLMALYLLLPRVRRVYLEVRR